MKQITSIVEMESATAAPLAQRLDAEPIHILFMIDELVEMGGAERALIRMIRLLPHDKFQATAITFCADEGQPLVINFLAEAMLCRLPCIAIDVGGNKEAPRWEEWVLDSE